mmetsp:Transcript_11/g.18  ORF Transcript_11/g.18 Transcript_11/m.18 type:complete len:89 (-) Transcript_11:54-320(-)
MVKVQVVNEPSKRLFGLKTLVLSFEYGALLGVAMGTVGGILMAQSYYSQDQSRSEKAKTLGKLSLQYVGGIAVFAGAAHLMAKIKIKG